MNRKNAAVIGSLVFVFALLVYLKPGEGGLVLPECEISDPVETEINFLVDNEVLENKGREGVEKELAASITYANTVLKNSCIPMTRALGEIRYVEIDKSKLTNPVSYSLHNALEAALGTDDLDAFYPEKHQFYGYVFLKEHQLNLNFSGRVEPNLSTRFFGMSAGADINTLEHELGHLAWAQHSDSAHPNLDKKLKGAYLSEFHHFLKRYARAYKCGNAGTVMSYENGTLPVYSSPDITYQGKVCGDAEKGDNARVLRDFALALKE